jgi:hypothetical protein
MNRNEKTAQLALKTIRHLSHEIGGRGSCTPAERQAGDYIAGQLTAMGVSDVRCEPFRAIASTYRPYILAFSAALIGTIIAWSGEGRINLIVSALLNAAAAWAMIAETEFSSNWTRWFLPKSKSHNVVGLIPPQGPARRRVVLCAHLDTHRTPIFYSSPRWHALFGRLVLAAFASICLGALVYLLGAFFLWEWVRWVGLALAGMILFALALSLQADFTPFSPGANDNASGVGVILTLVDRLRSEPLQHTEVWLAMTGCEEVASYGMQAFLDEHAAQLGSEAIYIILDEVGLGHPKYITADGLISKRKTHPEALRLARQAKAALPSISVGEEVGIAYTDALAATRRGLISLSIGSSPEPGSDEVSHWHQVSDTLDTINPKTLVETHNFTWQVLQEIDRQD